MPAPPFVPVWARAHGVTAAVLALLTIIAAGCANPFGANATPTATFTPTATHTATSTPTPTATATPTATPTPSLPANPDALQRWITLPVTYCIVTGDGYVSADEFAAAIERAFATWGVPAVNTGACDGMVDEDDVNEIGWGDLSAATNRGADTYEAGLTSLRYRECTARCDPDDPVHIVEADITIATSPPGAFRNERCLYSTMLHETGHFLGLEHLAAPAVMAPETTTCPDELTAADRGALFARYGAAAQPQ